MSNEMWPLNHWPRPRIAAAIATALTCIVLLWPAIALAQGYSGGQGSGSVDDQALAIANELQCPICENVTVAYSNSELAAQMRQVIRDKLDQGWTHDQIIQYFVARYGEGILENPPKRGFNLLVWVLPLASVLAGLGIVAAILRTRPAPPAGTPTSPASGRPLDEEEERLLADALGGSR